jgi:hypothetical protein
MCSTRGEGIPTRHSTTSTPRTCATACFLPGTTCLREHKNTSTGEAPIRTSPAGRVLGDGYIAALVDPQELDAILTFRLSSRLTYWKNQLARLGASDGDCLPASITFGCRSVAAAKRSPT